MKDAVQNLSSDQSMLQILLSSKNRPEGHPQNKDPSSMKHAYTVGGVKYKKLWRKDEIERLVGLETKLTIRGDACNSARWGINQIDTQRKAF